MLKNRTVTLPLDKMPNKWVNLLFNMPEALTPLVDPGTNQPVPVEGLLPLFAEELIKQEVNTKDEYYSNT